MTSLNRGIVSFAGIDPVPDKLVVRSHLQKALLFELAMVRAEHLLDGDTAPGWDGCFKVAIERQRRHYDAKISQELGQCDLDVASHTARNLVEMLRSVNGQHPDVKILKSPVIPGLGWIASGVGDFSLGGILIEVKNTDRNFVSGDFRQVLMYWMLKYAASIENGDAVWSDCLLLNPRRNAALAISFNYLLRSASVSASHVELYELMRSIVGQEFEWN